MAIQTDPNVNMKTVVIPAKPVSAGQSYNDGNKVIDSAVSTTTGKNITKIPTSEIQKNLGGIADDNEYGPQTTEAVKNFQTQAGITVDGIFGPETEAAYSTKYPSTTPPSTLISTSDSSRSSAIKNSTDLSSLLSQYNLGTGTATNTSNNNKTDINGNNLDSNGNLVPKEPDVLGDKTSGTADDPYIQQLDTIASHSNDATKVLVSSIKATKQKQANNLDKQYNDYKSGLQLLGIQTNQATVTPDLLMSHINTVESEHQAKLNDLDNEEIKALTDAQTAQDNNDFKVLNEKMTYLKQIRSEKTQALKDYQESLTKYNDTVKKQGDASAKLIAPDIYNAVKGLDANDQEQFLLAISQKYNIPLNSIVTSLVAQKPISDKADAANVLSPSEAKALGVPYGTTKTEAAKMGITPKTATKAASTTFKTAPAIASVSTQMESVKGEDGYIDPDKWVAARTNWNKLGGTDATFNSTFKKYLNPKSYKQAGFKTSSRSASGN